MSGNIRGNAPYTHHTYSERDYSSEEDDRRRPPPLRSRQDGHRTESGRVQERPRRRESTMQRILQSGVDILGELARQNEGALTINVRGTSVTLTMDEDGLSALLRPSSRRGALLSPETFEFVRDLGRELDLNVGGLPLTLSAERGNLRVSLRSDGEDQPSQASLVGGFDGIEAALRDLVRRHGGQVNIRGVPLTLRAEGDQFSAELRPDREGETSPIAYSNQGGHRALLTNVRDRRSSLSASIPLDQGAPTTMRFEEQGPRGTRRWSASADDRNTEFETQETFGRAGEGRSGSRNLRIRSNQEGFEAHAEDEDRDGQRLHRRATVEGNVNSGGFRLDADEVLERPQRRHTDSSRLHLSGDEGRFDFDANESRESTGGPGRHRDSTRLRMGADQQRFNLRARDTEEYSDDEGYRRESSRMNVETDDSRNRARVGGRETSVREREGTRSRDSFSYSVTDGDRYLRGGARLDEERVAEDESRFQSTGLRTTLGSRSTTLTGGRYTNRQREGESSERLTFARVESAAERRLRRTPGPLPVNIPSDVEGSSGE